jgi:hypothetical protein
MIHVYFVGDPVCFQSKLFCRLSESCDHIASFTVYRFYFCRYFHHFHSLFPLRAQLVNTLFGHLG